jgi:hypothetical protein
MPHGVRHLAHSARSRSVKEAVPEDMEEGSDAISPTDQSSFRLNHWLPRRQSHAKVM